VAPVGANEAIVFDNFERWLGDKLDVLQPTWCFAEDQFMGAASSRMVMQRLLGMRAIAAMLCHRHGVRLRWVPVQTVQRFFTSRGQWPKGQKKAATIRACRAMGWNPQTDNQADALAVWAYGEAQVRPDLPRAAGVLFARAG
jgi:hypothetical protein